MSYSNWSPDGKKRFVDDVLKSKGLYVPKKPDETDPQKQILQHAAKLYYDVRDTVLKPLLKALPAPSNYDRAATQQLLFINFRQSFALWSKDDLLFLVSVMHSVDLEKEGKEAADAGICGPDMSKPI